MNKKRLLKLADFLETVPRKSFEMGSWVESEASKPEGARPGECGFAGCAMGWAAHAKLFRGLALKTTDDDDPFDTALYPVYQGFEEYAAAEALFNIDAGAATHLFSPYFYVGRDSNPTPKQVAKRIRKFVESGSLP